MKIPLPHRFLTAAVVSAMGLASSAQGQILAVDYGGDYRTSNQDAPDKTVTLESGNFDYQSDVDDRRGFRAIDSDLLTITVDPANPAFDNKTKVFNAGFQIVNINSATDPAGPNVFGYVDDTVDSLQVTSTAGTANMDMAWAPYVAKANFVNGGDDAQAELSFEDAAGSASFELQSLVGGTFAEARALVLNGTTWYVSQTTINAAGTFSVNGATETWQVYDPSSNLSVDFLATPVTVSGSALTDIQAFGALVEVIGFDGTSADAAQVGISAMSASLQAVVPETDPVTVLNVAQYFDDNNADGLDTSTLADFEVVDDPNAKLVVTIGYEQSTPQVTGVTYGGVPMTLAVATGTGNGNNRDADIYYLDDPTPGTADIVVTWDTINSRCRIGAASLGNAADGVSFTVDAAGGTTDTLSTDVTTIANDTLVIAVGNKNNNGTSFTAVPYAPENIISSGSGNSSYISSGYIQVQSASTNTYTYTLPAADGVDAAFAGFASAGIVEADPVSVLNVAQVFDSNNTDGLFTSTLADFEVVDDPNAKLVVTIGYEQSTPQVTGVTYGGVPMTLAIATGGTRDADVYYLDDPTPGTADIVVTWDTINSRCRIGAASLGNAADGVSFTVDAADGTTDTLSTDVTTTSRETLVIAIGNKNNNGSAFTAVPYAPENIISSGNGQSCFISSGYIQVVAPSTNTFTYTLPVADGVDAAFVGFASAGIVEADPVSVLNVAQVFDSNNTDGLFTSTLADFEVVDDPNAKLVVTIGYEQSTPQVTGVTYGGVPMTLAIATGGTRDADVYYLDDPTPGTADIVVTWDTINSRCRIGAASLGNAADGVSFTVDAAGATTDTLSTDVTTTSRETLVIAVGNKNNNGSAFTAVPYAPENIISSGNGQSCFISSGYIQVVAPSTNTYTYTLPSNSVDAAFVGFASAGVIEVLPADPITVLNVASVLDNVSDDGLDTSTLANFRVIDDANAKLVVVLGYESSTPQVTGVTYGGVPMTLAIANGGNRDADIYYLDDPTPGDADIVVTWDTIDQECRIGAASLGNAADGFLFTVDASGLSTDVTTTTSDAFIVAASNKNGTSGFVSVPYPSEDIITQGNSNSSVTSAGYIQVPEPTTTTITYDDGGAGSDTAIAVFGSAGLAPPRVDLQEWDLPEAQFTPTIDGTISVAEWGDAFPLPMVWPDLGAFPNVGGQKYEEPTEADFSATIYYKWDATYLYIAFVMTDDAYIRSSTILDGGGFPNDHILHSFNPDYTNTDWANTLSFEVYENSDDSLVDTKILQDGTGTLVLTNSDFASGTTAGGWVIESRMLWTEIVNNGLYVPTAGDKYGTHNMIIDNDVDDGTRDTFLYSAGNTPQDPSIYHTVTLAGLYNTYDNWIARFTDDVGFLTFGTDDPDGDGLDNNAEYFLGGHPGVADATTVVPVSSTDTQAGLVTFVYNRRIGATGLGITYSIESTTSLSSAFAPAAGVVEVSAVAISDAFEEVTVTVPVDVGTKFLRLNVTQP